MCRNLIILSSINKLDSGLGIQLSELISFKIYIEYDSYIHSQIINPIYNVAISLVTGVSSENEEDQDSNSTVILTEYSSTT